MKVESVTRQLNIRVEKIRFSFATINGLGAGGVKFAPGFIRLAESFFLSFPWGVRSLAKPWCKNFWYSR